MLRYKCGSDLIFINNSMRVIVVVLTLLAFATTFNINPKRECPETMQVKCIDDIRAGEPTCEDFIKGGGTDISKLLKCLSYVQTAQTDCLDCFCDLVEAFGFQVKACQQ